MTGSAGPAGPAPDEPLDAVLRRHLPASGPDDRLADAGVGSAQLLALLVDVERTLGIELPDEVLALEGLESVRDLHRVIEAARRGEPG